MYLFVEDISCSGLLPYTQLSRVHNFRRMERMIGNTRVRTQKVFFLIETTNLCQFD